jgi:mono/diheme cytochrome c family protein
MRSGWCFVALALGLSACSKKAEPPAAAKQYYAEHCVPCHGAQGRGDGPTSAALNPKPRDYTSGAWQKSVTDDDIKKIIVGGGPAVGKSPLMPPNPDLTNSPEMVNGLVAVVRAFER